MGGGGRVGRRFETEVYVRRVCLRECGSDDLRERRGDSALDADLWDLYVG